MLTRIPSFTGGSKSSCFHWAKSHHLTTPLPPPSVLTSNSPLKQQKKNPRPSLLLECISRSCLATHSCLSKVASCSLNQPPTPFPPLSIVMITIFSLACRGWNESLLFLHTKFFKIIIKNNKSTLVFWAALHKIIPAFSPLSVNISNPCAWVCFRCLRTGVFEVF